MMLKENVCGFTRLSPSEDGSQKSDIFVTSCGFTVINVTIVRRTSLKGCSSSINIHTVQLLKALDTTFDSVSLVPLLMQMQRSISSTNNVYRNLLRLQKPPTAAMVTWQQPSCDVFINHRGIDTKKNVAGLLYNHLVRLRLRPFLDSKNMKPGDKLFDKIDAAITRCKVGVVVFSPRYCQSYFCLHELARIMEAKKKVIPVFCDVKPSELIVRDDGSCSKHQLDRFKTALEEAKYTVGLTFDSSNGDWPGFLMTATEAIMENLKEVEEEERQMHIEKSINHA
uniref:TIR domain-containing protein n=2 Tax=Lactuca sativa TaxID=4236 RepID=A0A9R1VVD8_LACSA|nr:hypothetical protein LSAT_V11C400178270 [Lactuca sativa]